VTTSRPDEQVRSSQRRWFQFSLRTLLLVITAFAVWLGWRVKLAREQEAAVEAIQALGGSLIYRYQEEDPAYRGANNPYPVWLTEFVGEEYLLSVAGVYLEGDDVGDSALLRIADHLQRLPDLRWLELRDTQVTDDGLVHVRNLRTLERLYIRTSEEDDAAPIQITDAGLQHLEDLFRLKSLTIANGPVTGAGLRHLNRLSKLETIDLRRTQVSDEALAQLRSHRQLKELILWHTPVTDAGLVHLRDLTNLESLFLWDNDVTDTGLENLKELKALRELDLSGTNVTDAGLVHVAGLVELRHLALDSTRVSDAGLHNLERLTRLKVLSLYDCSGVTTAGVQPLLTKLPACSIDR